MELRRNFHGILSEICYGISRNFSCEFNSSENFRGIPRYFLNRILAEFQNSVRGIPPNRISPIFVCGIRDNLVVPLEGLDFVLLTNRNCLFKSIRTETNQKQATSCHFKISRNCHLSLGNNFKCFTFKIFKYIK